MISPRREYRTHLTIKKDENNKFKRKYSHEKNYSTAILRKEPEEVEMTQEDIWEDKGKMEKEQE